MTNQFADIAKQFLGQINPSTLIEEGSKPVEQCNEWIKKFWGQYNDQDLAKFKAVETVEAEPGSVKILEIEVQNMSETAWDSGCYLA